MGIQVLEGTLSEIQRQLSDLRYAPDARVRVTIEQAGPKAATKQTRNGITLVPVKDPSKVLTTEFVKDLLESEWPMRIQLPDVNVLIALHDQTHQGYERAHRWFTSEGHLGWATCPLTENGFIRIFSQPALPNNVGTPAAAMIYLDDEVMSRSV